MKNKSILFITEVAIFAAFTTVLDLICGSLFAFSWTNGGSISIAMFPIFVMAIRWGLPGGFTTGIIVGIIQLILPTSYVAGVFQALLDYVFAFGILGIVGVIKYLLPKLNNTNRYIFTTILMLIAGLLRTLLHILSGVFFFGVNFIGSTVYNLPYMIPSILLSIIIVLILMYKTPQLIYREE